MSSPAPAFRVRLQNYTVFVRDQDRSIRFYVDQLGFRVVGDATFSTGARWVGVAPPDGTAILALVAAKPGSEEYARIGRYTQAVFLAEDAQATFEEWSRRGVAFSQPPVQPEWGGAYTTFEDVDGNSFALVGFDAVSRGLEAERQAAIEKLEADSRAKQELEIARQVQLRLFPQSLPPLRTLDYAGLCLQARQVGGDYYDFLPLGGQRLGLVVADISGKGIGAALLMAHLQASLRSQCAVASDQPERFLRSVNKLFCDNTPESASQHFCSWNTTTRRGACATRAAATRRPCSFGVAESWSASAPQARLSACSLSGIARLEKRDCRPETRWHSTPTA